jgi:hypothetical protein
MKCSFCGILSEELDAKFRGYLDACFSTGHPVSRDRAAQARAAMEQARHDLEAHQSLCARTGGARAHVSDCGQSETMNRLSA